MAHPDYSKPKTKTLLDLYEEKKSMLDQGQPFNPQDQKNLVMDQSGNILEAGTMEDEPTGPVGQAVFWAVCLTMVHFTLDVLVFNQYRQSIEWPEIWRRTFTILPILFVLVWMLRSKTAQKAAVVRQAFLFAVAVGAGCYCIHVGNTYDYYAVMKQAPPVGTLWIWSVIESNVWCAAASAGINLAYLWWKGYSAF
ncbi:hypothetical protein EJ03DRAFT_328911 [Teratosphaeria nubilosa]|uniref:DUF7719 domain-containing protein n=1 Tax=Teratosphaeria nubilosa TaxID=161662 RepID=A0A6G1L476_9PEZI|nr:hypothetical protein EJ03DRAFT_328911 [Teratosphaeria nubilosa]